MTITALKRASDQLSQRPVRDTGAQDTVLKPAGSLWHRRRLLLILVLALAALTGLLLWLAHGWLSSSQVVSAQRLQLATVVRGHFARDVAAQGTVIAAVNPTLFAVASGTVSYVVRAGDSVSRGQVLATLDSPELANEHARERATLDSLNAALAREEIEIRKQLLTSQQHADLAQVSIQAAERENKRAQWAWDQHVISERDYQRSIDEVSTAKLNFEQARAAALLEHDSVALELRTRRLERDRQALVVAGLKRRIDELTVRSPVTGMVADLAQVNRAKVAESAPLLTVLDLTAFEVEFHVAETYAGEIKPGMPAQLTVGGHMEAGTVTAISPEVRNSEVTGRVRFSGAQPPGLRQNERAAVRIVLDERDAVMKFERGPLIDEATRSLYVARNGRAVRIPVVLGAASITEIEAIRGLAPGERVIISDMRDFNEARQLVIAH
jgi:HlyD family secretion protein